MPLPRQWEAAGRTDATAAPGDRAWSWDALPYGCIHNSLMPSPPLLLAIEEVMMSLLADDGLVLCLGAEKLISEYFRPAPSSIKFRSERSNSSTSTISDQQQQQCCGFLLLCGGDGVGRRHARQNRDDELEASCGIKAARQTAASSPSRRRQQYVRDMNK
ncbi:hypothetical protein OsI_37640 [Oryza sativa Indica Group]|uniref:Uncharacterized protein n=2 Tax=Oryza sativa TaxID=4530 RepID=Q2QX20_ORYSJ|nr:hypothetical protein LOC_Os12g07460 [Oryza sativa Japonica Group]EAY82427.1 hypothetical protein OsI_37640 [Oryza sativa Indica Group]